MRALRGEWIYSSMNRELKHRPREAGLTLGQMLILIVPAVVLVVLFAQFVRGALTNSAVAHDLGKARFIWKTVQVFAQEHAATGEPYYGWPGDLRERDQIRNTTDFVKLLVKLDYMKEGDLKVFNADRGKQAPGLVGFKVIPNSSESTCGYKFFAVKERNPDNTIFITTANFEDFQKPPFRKSIPYGDKGFIVFRKGGEGNWYTKSQTDPKLIGIMPDGTDLEHPGSAAASLLPQE